MENRRFILDELQSISPTLAEIAAVNPYQVPTGYFENFASGVLILVKDGNPSAVFGTTTETPYQVPSNYFKELPGILLAIAKGEESSMLPAKAENPYHVPQGYFDAFADNVLRRLKSEDNLSVQKELAALSPLLSKLDKKMPFTTPAGYFSDLTGNMVSSVKSGELEELSPLMSDLKSANPYQVPTGYFQNFPELTLRRVKKDAPAKVVSMTFGKKTMRYATAAIVAGIIFVGGLLFINRQNDTVPPNTVAQTEEIQRETQTKVKGLSDDELAGFLENQTSAVPDILAAAAVAEIDSEDVMMMLADVPDAELKQYLVEYGDEKVLTN